MSATKLEQLLKKYQAGVPEYCDQDETLVGSEALNFGPGARCTSHAEYIATQETGLVCGFYVEDNPCEMSEFADGHDFALIDGRFIVDTWLFDWVQAIEKPVLDMANAEDGELIRRFYGDPDKWERQAPKDRTVKPFIPKSGLR